MATGPPSEDWAKTFNTLKEFHDSAYVKLDEGIKLESEGKKDVALSKYEEGLRLMDLALELRIECPANADLNWEKACVMLQKLRKTRKEVLSRIADVQVVQPQPMDPGLAPPPTYEEAMSLPLPSTSGNPSVNPTTFQSLPAPTRRPIPNCGPMTYSELGDALSNLKVETNLQSAQVLCTFENVRIYFIHPDGTVSAPSEPSTLRVLQLEDGADEVAKYFLQVGEWFYPLIPDVSPCLRTSYGAYILPDVTCEQDGAAVGLILPSDTDESMSELLQDLLHTDVAVEDETPPLSPSLQRDDSTSAKVAKGLITGEHKHGKKFLLKHGRHRRHRHKESDSSTVDRTEDENYDENFKKHRHGRRHRGHHGHRHRGRYDSEGNIYGEPPPYDEIGEEAKTLGNKEDEDEEDVEEIAGVEVDDSERSSKHYGRGKYSKRHKRHINSDRSGFSAKIDRGTRRTILFHNYR